VSSTDATPADRPAPGGAVGAVPEEDPGIGWPRAILSGLAILVVSFAATVYPAQLILTRVHGHSRSTVQYWAATLFVVLVLLIAFALRRLQARRLI